MPSTPCLVCSKDTIRDTALQCGRCELLFHATCDAEYKDANRAEIAVLSRYKVICCKCSIDRRPEFEADIDARFSELTAQIKDNRSSLASVLSKLDVIASKQDSSESSDDNSSEYSDANENAPDEEGFQVQESKKKKKSRKPAPPLITTADMRKAILEAREKEKTEKCLVLRGVPESEADSRTDREKEDFDVATKILAAVYGNDGSEPIPVEVFRLGKPSDEFHRLLKVELRRSYEQSQTLRLAYQLKNHPEFSKIFIRPSFSKEQQKISADLHAALKKAKEEDGDSEAFILRKGLYPESWKLATRRDKDTHAENLPKTNGMQHGYGQPPPKCQPPPPK